jgi:hypothetical protein
MNEVWKRKPMATLLDPFEVRSVAPAPVDNSVDVEWAEDIIVEPIDAPAPVAPPGVSALAWSRARGWTVED